MPSSHDPSTAVERARAGETLASWNRRTHYFLGLYLLFFVWLFALTGLLLNHSQWEFAQFWPQRKVTDSEHAITSPRGRTMLDDARDLSRQLGLAGEIEWVTNRVDSKRLEFRVVRPGLNLEVKADLEGGRARVQRTELNAWGFVRILHTFTGVRANDPRKNERDWIVTTAWAVAMDAVAVGLILMVASGIIIWWRSGERRPAGILVLTAGTLACSALLAGWRWISF